MPSGYIYCFSNKAMPGIYKIGATERDPQERLNEANSSDTWRPPEAYEIECIAKTHDIYKKEHTIHRLLNSKRIHMRREFFRESLDTIKLLFDLVHSDTCTEFQEQTVPLSMISNVEEVIISGVHMTEIKGFSINIFCKFYVF